MNPQMRSAFRVAHLVRQRLLDRQQNDIRARLQQLLTMQHRMKEVARLTSLMDRSVRRGYSDASRRLDEKVDPKVRDLLQDVQRLVNDRYRDDWLGAAVPTLRAVLEDLDQLESEFGSWTFDRQDQVLTVSTDPIQLEDVYLGPFEIQLPLARLDRERHVPLRTVAIEPNHAAGSEHITHPHVSDDRLCTGEATASLATALRSGRLADFFVIVRSVLQTYNEESAYVRLESWTGASCYDCGTRSGGDDFCCELCSHDFCEDCIASCESCGRSICGDCSRHCDHCEETHCRKCLGKCAGCGETACVGCLDNDLCPTCIEEQDDESEEQQDERTGPQAGAAETVPPPLTRESFGGADAA